ncbi:hypothetical protein [Streptomyces sp. NPDC055186]
MAMMSNGVAATFTSPTALLASIGLARRAFEQAQEAMLRAGPRLHNVCGYRSPTDYEHDHRANSALELAA